MFEMFWATFILCASVALASSGDANGAWRTNTEYKYQLRTQTLASMPNLKNQWIGLFTKADLTIRPYSEDLLVATVSNGKHAEWHDQLPNDWNQYVSDSKLNYEPMQMNAKPFELRLKNGVVDKIAVDSSLSNVELNQLKAIVSQLQVDVRGENLIKSVDNQLPVDEKTQAFYKVMEPTVSGHCETLYDITPLPDQLTQKNDGEYMSPFAYELSQEDQLYEIIKTKNYSECEQYKGYHSGIHAADNWRVNTNQMGSLKKSAVSRVVIAGAYDKYTILSSATTNRVVNTVSDEKNKRDSMVVSKVNLTLVGMEQTAAGNSDSRPQQLIEAGSLVYAYDLPSDAENRIRVEQDKEQMKYNFEEREGAWKSRSRRSILNHHRLNTIGKQLNGVENEQQQDQEQHQNYNHHHRHQYQQKSIREHSETGEEFKEELYSVDERQANYQPKPELEKAPESPLLPFFIGYKGQSIQNAEGINTVERAEKLAREIAEDIQTPNEIPKSNTLSKFNILIDVIRTMNTQQIKELTQSLQNQKLVWKVHRDAVVEAGTAPAAIAVMEWIENERVTGEEAAELIAALPATIREPTIKLQKRFLQFATRDVVENDVTMREAAWFALTRFLKQAQFNNRYQYNYYPVHSFGPFSERDDKLIVNEVIPYFTEELETGLKEKDSSKTLLAIRALGNLAHPEILNVFAQYLEGKVPASDFQRLAMIVALDEYAKVNVKDARTLFFKVSQNKGETPEIRSAAIFSLFKINPSAQLLQRLAEQSNTEENEHVRSTIRYALQSTAKLTLHKNKHVAANAKAAINLLKPEEDDNMRYSLTYLRDYAMKHLDASFEQQISFIGGKDKVIPNGFISDLIDNVQGFRRRTEYQVLISNIEQLVGLFREHLDDSHWQQNESSTSSRKTSPHASLADKIKSMFNAQIDEQKPIEGQILMSIMNTKRFFAIDKNTIEDMPRQVKEAMKSLQDGHQINYSKLYNDEAVTIAFPLETGLPFIYEYQIPTFVQLRGEIQARTMPNIHNDNQQDTVQIPKAVNISADVEIVYSTQLNAKLGFINPRTNQRYASGHVKKVQVYAPVTIKADIDLESMEFHGEIKPLHSQKSSKLIHASVWPYTSRQNILELRPMAESRNTRVINVREPRTIRQSFGGRYTGNFFRIQATFENQKFIRALPLSLLDKLNIKSLSSPEHFEVQIDSNTDESKTKSIQFAVRYEKEMPVTYGEQTEQQQRSRREQREQHVQSKLNTNFGTIPKSVLDSNRVNAVHFGVRFDGEDKIDHRVVLAKVRKANTVFMYASQNSDNPALKIERTFNGKIHMEYADHSNEYRQHNEAKTRQTPETHIRLKYDDKYATYESSEIYAKIASKRQSEHVSSSNVNVEFDFEGLSPNVRMMVYATLNNIANQLKKYQTYQQVANEVSVFASEDLSSVNMTVNAPLYEKIAEFDTTSVCKIGKEHLNTFDGETIKHQFGNTWHLVMHTPRKYRLHSNRQQQNLEREMSVLVRNFQGQHSGNNKLQHEVLILLRERNNEIVSLLLTPNQGSSNIPRVYVNSEEKFVARDNAIEIRSNQQSNGYLARIYLTEKDNLVVDAFNGEYEVSFDGHIHIKRDALYQTSYGICGSSNKPYMMSPEKCVMRSDKHYVASWSILDQESESSPAAQLKRQIQQEECIKERIYYSNIINEQNSNGLRYNSRHQNESENVNAQLTRGQRCETKHQTQYVQVGNQLCFTLRPLPVCAPGCKANGKNQLNIDVYCHDASDPAAQEYKQRIDYHHNLDMSSHSATTKISFNAPRQCVRA